MEDMLLKILMTVFSAVAAGGISLVFWNVRKNNGKDERRAERMENEHVKTREEFVVLRTKFERLLKDWDDKNVDKAFDSARRCHDRIDKLESD